MSNSSRKRSRGSGSAGKPFRQRSSVDLEFGEVIGGPIVDHNLPAVRMFHEFQEELDTRHDKFERIVKNSRNITIESKRAIFLLHRIDSDESREKILSEVKQKMNILRNTEWRQIALELQNEDPYQFIRAYSPGLQEYVEAMAFFHYLEQQTLLTPQQLDLTLTFSELSESDEVKDEIVSAVRAADGTDSTTTNELPRPLSVYVPPMEYMLGLADLTGEMMRMAIHCIARGEFKKPFELCQYIRSMHNAFLSYGNQPREMFAKFGVLRQSMRKVEDACYALKVRGSEMPKHLLADAVNSMSHQPLYVESTNNDGCLD